ncbi:MAG: LamG domain-containing protein [Gammaproteobacteria bacterium]|nr:LamG domain-containing protein [Gammaproteobacteria bacterium]MBT8110826.1 LamG domain-containing protein [Gammaproteobacteria bacterium]NNL45525.1 LamG domain-containing protein [Woeseiaceae bacterium]
MTKVIRIATRALGQRSLRAATVALLASVVLAACGGGAQTTDNPLSQGPGNNNDAVYTGPVAENAEVLKFQQEFWANAKTTDRCGSCHNESVGQLPMFVRNDDVNEAYREAVTVTNMDQPSLSRIVEKVGSMTERHNCWVADPGVCGTIMTTWIENWVGAAEGGGRQIVLTAPPDRDPSDSRNFPDSPALFQQFVYTPILAEYCAGCHSSESATAQQPYFAEMDVATAYEAAKSKISLDSPADSRFVIKVSPGSQGGEAHNCWDNDCPTASVDMLNAITDFADAIEPTTVNSDLVYSKAVRLVDGTVASGGNRYENDQIALWEFKTGTGLTAFDTSGVDPAIDLTLEGDVTWYGGWGITIGSNAAAGPGKARGFTTASRKLANVLRESGEFSIEAWVVPANVTQEMARIVTYSAGQMSRNFTLQQTLYNYDFLLRTNAQDAEGEPLTDLNGNPQLSTPDADEVLQATLQHVVATYSPIDGRRIYVNGQLVSNADPIPGGTFVDWEDTFALVLGNEASGDGLWEGTFRLAAVHRRALSEEQINQNFDAGVGERFYLLFDISERINTTERTAYVLFEAQQFDSYAYLFDKPHFTTIDGSAPSGIAMEGMRVAMNGQEAPVGQSYANLVESLDLSDPTTLDELGQPLSVLGAVLPLEKGPQDDEFFLTFDNLDGVVFDRDQDPMLVLTDYIATDDARKSDIGVKTFDEIDATYAAITGINRTTYQRGGNFLVDETFQELRQSLPAVENIEAVLSSHQVAIAQLAIQYCDAAVEDASIWPGFNFDAAPGQAFSVANRDGFVEPLILRAVGHSSTSPQLDSQPGYAIVHDEIAAFISGGGDRPDNLIDRLLGGTSDTRAIGKGVCASVLGSAATLVQ